MNNSASEVLSSYFLDENFKNISDKLKDNKFEESHNISGLFELTVKPEKISQIDFPTKSQQMTET